MAVDASERSDREDFEDACIVLIGHRGSGKTTVARVLSRGCGHAVIDVDEVVQAASGRTIAELFSEGGEPLFRKAERQAIAGLTPGLAAVISVGAGAVEDAVNRDALAELGVVVWLQAAPATRQGRVSADPDSVHTRPPLGSSGQPDPDREARRDGLYAAMAALCIDTTGRTPQQVCGEIIRHLQPGVLH